MHTRVEAPPALNVREVQRQVAALLPEARPASAGESTLEIAGQGMDAPRLMSATLLEAGPLGARRVEGDAREQFRAFLDGTQCSEVANHLGAVPIMLGRAAAVVRVRRVRRLQTWGTPLVETRVYCPRAMLPAGAWRVLADAFGELLVDSGDREGAADIDGRLFGLGTVPFDEFAQAEPRHRGERQNPDEREQDESSAK